MWFILALLEIDVELYGLANKNRAIHFPRVLDACSLYKYIYVVHIQHVQKCSIYHNNSARDIKHKNTTIKTTTIKTTTIKATTIQIKTVQTTVKYDVCTWNVPSHNKNILT